MSMFFTYLFRLKRLYCKCILPNTLMYGLLHHVVVASGQFFFSLISTQPIHCDQEEKRVGLFNSICTNMIHWLQCGKNLHATLWTETKEWTKSSKFRCIASSFISILIKSCMKKAQIKKIGSREREHGVLEQRKGQAILFHSICSWNHWCIMGLFENIFCLTIISLLPVLCFASIIWLYYDRYW